MRVPELSHESLTVVVESCVSSRGNRRAVLESMEVGKEDNSVNFYRQSLIPPIPGLAWTLQVIG